MTADRVFTLERRSIGAATIFYLDGPLRLASGPTCRKDVPWEP